MTYGNYGPTKGLRLAITDKKQPGRPLTPTELSERWPTRPPETLALPPGAWIHRDAAAAAIAKANGCPGDLERGACWLQSMITAGLCDCREFEVKLLDEGERAGTPRPGSPEATNEQVRLGRLRADLKALGYTVTKTPDAPA